MGETGETGVGETGMGETGASGSDISYSITSPSGTISITPLAPDPLGNIVIQIDVV